VNDIIIYIYIYIYYKTLQTTRRSVIALREGIEKERAPCKHRHWLFTLRPISCYSGRSPSLYIPRWSFTTLSPTPSTPRNGRHNTCTDVCNVIPSGSHCSGPMAQKTRPITKMWRSGPRKPIYCIIYRLPCLVLHLLSSGQCRSACMPHLLRDLTRL